MSKDLSSSLLSVDAVLRDALIALDKNGMGIVFVQDASGRVVGVLTDGDARRSFLEGADLQTPVAGLVNRRFKSGKTSLSHEENLRLLNEEIRHLPVLDETGKLSDILSWAEMWRMPVMEPLLGGNELKYVADCITSNWISSKGPYVRAFEKKFAEYQGTPHALTTCNGTVALHLALLALGVGPGDEVLVPDLTFAASANAVIYCGAKPVLVDVRPDEWNMDPSKMEAAITPKTKAVMPVHLYGHPCDMDPIMALAKKHRLFVVEDCAEALGARYRGRLVGTFGDIACFSFFSNKVITTGEGGMVTTSDAALQRKMTVLRDHGMTPEKRYWHEEVGYNYRMTNLQAAVGLAQIEQVDRFLKSRREIADWYREELRGIPGITLPPEMPWAVNIHWLYSILVDEKKTGISRDQLIEGLQRDGIETRRFFYPLHEQPPYRSQELFPVTDRLSAQGISLPSSHALTREEVKRVARSVRAQIENQKIRADFKNILTT